MNMMPAVKRQASDSFSSSQVVVKRQKSSSDLKDGSTSGSAKGGVDSGAIIQSVSGTSSDLNKKAQS